MKIVVKGFVLLSLVLVTASAALAQQQPAEWRPSIAEDNKAATLDDTLKFIVGTLNDPSLNEVFHPEEGGSLSQIFAAKSSAKCSLEWGVVQMGAADARETTVTDLSKVDPLSLAVIPVVGGVSAWGFKVVMSGTSGSQFAGVTYYSRPAERRADFWARAAKAQSASCAPGDKKCRSGSTKEAHAYFWLGGPDLLSGQEAAHRLARALMHAALLCGGAKAVSPF